MPLHDIGMARVPDLILYKPDKLTTEEIAAIKRHAVAGRDIIIGLETQVASHDESVRLQESRLADARQQITAEARVSSTFERE